MTTVHRRGLKMGDLRYVGVVLACVLVTLCAGCIAERSNGDIAEACNASADCRAGLICVQRQCAEPPLEEFSERPDASFADGSDSSGADVVTSDIPPPPSDTGQDSAGEDIGTPDVIEPDVVEPDTGSLCVDGERSCLNTTEIRVCDGGDRYRNESCPLGTFCNEGAVCAPRNGCRDEDGDGFGLGLGCDGPVDCNDTVATAFPGADELCDGLDNDCNGRIDEGVERACQNACGQGIQTCVGGRWEEACSAPSPVPEICGNDIDDDCDGVVDDDCGCCQPGSCANGQICDGCACVVPESNRCAFQNQPCDANLVQQDGIYFCLEIDFSGVGVCTSPCDLSVPNPETTCPAPNSVCFDSDAQGLCFSACDATTQTGCVNGQACYVFPGQDLCLPSGSLPPNAPCDESEGVFAQCAEGAICLDLGLGQTDTCTTTCDPTRVLEEGLSPCRDQTACRPNQDNFGFCIPSLGRSSGAVCARDERGQMCDDRSFCTRVGRGEFACTPLCRLDDPSDCSNGRSCRFEDTLGADNYGVCF